MTWLRPLKPETQIRFMVENKHQPQTNTTDQGGQPLETGGSNQHRVSGGWRFRGLLEDRRNEAMQGIDEIAAMLTVLRAKLAAIRRIKDYRTD